MKFEGIITPLLTPFFEDTQEINFDACGQLVEHLISHGVSGLFMLGSNGEFHVMSDDEKVSLAKYVIEKTAGRVPVYVGTGGNSTRQVIELSKRVEAVGADALSVITPYFIAPSDNELIEHYKAIASSVKIPIILYNLSKRVEAVGADALSVITPYFIAPSDNELIEHYKAIASSVKIPIILYNFPKNTGINLSVDVVKELSYVENIAAIKDSSGSLENMEGYIKAVENRMSVLVGSDSLMLKAFQLGAVGAVAGTSNLLTDINVAIYNNFKKGDLEKAQHYQLELEELRSVTKLGTVPAILKKAVAMSGIPVGPARFPALNPSDDIVEKIAAMLKYYNK